MVYNLQDGLSLYQLTSREEDLRPHTVSHIDIPITARRTITPIVSEDGKMLVFHDEDTGIFLWDLNEGQELSRLNCEQGKASV